MPSFERCAAGAIETSTERLAWLIIVASIPAGVLALALENQLRTITAKPELAAIFLMVNGCLLLGFERFRRRAEVRELAIREGAKPDGARKLDTLEYREALVIGAAQSTALVAGISRDGVTMGAGLVRGLDHSDSAHFAFLLATPVILAAGLVQAARAARPSRRRHPRPGDRGLRDGGRDGRLHGRVPGALVQDPHADPLRAVLPRVRGRDGHLHADIARARRLPGRRRRIHHH